MFIRLVLVLTAVSLLGQTAHAAKCRYQENSTDKFTKVVTRWTKWNPVMSTWHFQRRHHVPHVSAHYHDGEVDLLIKVASMIQEKEPPDPQYLDEYMVVSAGAQLLVKFQDESMIRLRASRDARAKVYTEGDDESGYRSTGEVVLHYPLDEGSIAALWEQPVIWIRLSTEYKAYEFEIHKRSVNDFGSAVRCAAGK